MRWLYPFGMDIKLHPRQFFHAGRLVKNARLHYRLTMSLKKHFALAVLLFCGLRPAGADVIQLKDQAAVTGKILAE